MSMFNVTRENSGRLKDLWHRKKIDERVQWCQAAGLTGMAGSRDWSYMSLTDLYNLLQVIDLNSGKLKEIKMTVETKKTPIEIVEETTAQATAPEANKKDILKGKPAKEPKVPKAEKTPKVKTEKKPKADRSKVDEATAAETAETTPVKPGAIAKLWTDATNRAKINMLQSVNVRKNQFRKAWGELDKEDKTAIMAGDLNILSVRGRAGTGKKVEGKAPKTTAKSVLDQLRKILGVVAAPTGEGDALSVGDLSIRIKNVKQVNENTFTGTGVDSEGKRYFVFVTEKSAQE